MKTSHSAEYTNLGGDDKVDLYLQRRAYISIPLLGPYIESLFNWPLQDNVSTRIDSLICADLGGTKDWVAHLQNISLFRDDAGLAKWWFPEK